LKYKAGDKNKSSIASCQLDISLIELLLPKLLPSSHAFSNAIVARWPYSLF